MNQTIEKFGYPKTAIAEGERWVVMLRPGQVTLGAAVVACKEDARSLPEVSAEAFVELKKIARELERCLREAFEFDKINYLILMMIDPHVHLHVVPRYAAGRVFASTRFTDPGWPRQPVMAYEHQIPDSEFDELREYLSRLWRQG